MNKRWIIVCIVVFIIAISFVLFQSNMKGENGYKDIDLTTFQEKLNSSEEFSIYIYSPSCPACEKLAPILNSIIEEKDLEVFALDISKENNIDIDFFKNHKIVLTPTLINYHNGYEKNRNIGETSKKGLSEFFEQ